MTDRTSPYPATVQRALSVLPLAAQAAALAQLPFAHGLDDQLTVVTDAWLRCAQGDDATDAARWIASCRRRNAMDMRCPGRAFDFEDDGLPSWWVEPQLIEQEDPIAALLAAEAIAVYRDGLRAAGIAVDAAPATVGTMRGLATAEVSQRTHRGLRSVQSQMRRLCRAELDGQGVLGGIPMAHEVYLARALGGAA